MKNIATSAAIVISAAHFLCAQTPERNPYYPLAKGNSWRYAVRKSYPLVPHPFDLIVPYPFQHEIKSESRMLERVTQVVNSSGRAVYEVWRLPKEGGGHGLKLTVTDAGVEEANTHSVILPSHPSPGPKWQGKDVEGMWWSNGFFRVLSVGKPCSGLSQRFGDCVLIEERDAGNRWSTVTTYAKGVGPVEYKSTRWTVSKDAGGLVPAIVQTSILDSYRVAP